MGVLNAKHIIDISEQQEEEEHKENLKNYIYLIDKFYDELHNIHNNNKTKIMQNNREALIMIFINLFAKRNWFKQFR